LQGNKPAEVNDRISIFVQKEALLVDFSLNLTSA